VTRHPAFIEKRAQEVKTLADEVATNKVECWSERASILTT
jgi:hypothetical protein